ncbi:hypothetical protein MVES_002594 [Malassezia vespertilionis]|uniref:DNA replication factor Cdt1 C-terminal domain-containing protein n=1 Tax=Malassezia vespertilionis TaxID=2020962 RepID=A0A2N1JAT3_9BASI|nr:hypothetical protein MVES_002594 [Malassezia vespertilionis]
MAEQRALRAATHWSARTVLPLAESLLSHASVLREINILCHELGAHVEAQFAVQPPFPFTLQASVHDSIGGVDDTDVVHAQCIPTLCIRAVDRKEALVQYWSVPQVLAKMQSLRTMRAAQARPRTAQHMDVRKEVLGETRPVYTPVGRIHVPLFPVAAHSSASWTLAIRAVAFHGTLGRAHTRISFVQKTSTHWVFCVAIRSVAGLCAAEFDQAHLQIRLSAFSGQRADAEVYATRPILLHGNIQSSDALCMQRTLRIPRCAHTDAWLTHGTAIVTVFAKPTHAHIARILAQDAEQERRALGTPPRFGADFLRLDAPYLHTRVNETKRRTASAHGVHVSVRVLTPHAPAPVPATRPPHMVLTPAPTKHIVLVLQHDSGTALPWGAIRSIQLGDVRTMDSTGTTCAHDPSFQSLQRTSETSTKDDALCVHACWDAVHDCFLVPTVRGQHLRATLEIVAEMGNAQCTLSMPLYFRVQRSAQRGAATALHGLFRVALLPSAICSPHELWRVDTRMHQVPGEAVLGPWLPRGISLIAHYVAALDFCAHTAAVCRTRMQLGACTVRRGTPPDIHAVLALWYSAATGSIACVHAHWNNARQSTATAQVHTTSDRVELDTACAMHGWLAMQTDPIADAWNTYCPFLLLRTSKKSDIVRTMYLHDVHAFHADIPKRKLRRGPDAGTRASPALDEVLRVRKREGSSDDELFIPKRPHRTLAEAFDTHPCVLPSTAARLTQRASPQKPSIVSMIPEDEIARRRDAALELQYKLPYELASTVALPAHMQLLLEQHMAVEQSLLVHMATHGAPAAEWDASTPFARRVRMPSIIAFSVLKPMVERTSRRSFTTDDFKRLVWVWSNAPHTKRAPREMLTPASPSHREEEAAGGMGFVLTRIRSVDPQTHRRTYDHAVGIEMVHVEAGPAHTCFGSPGNDTSPSARRVLRSPQGPSRREDMSSLAVWNNGLGERRAEFARRLCALVGVEHAAWLARHEISVQACKGSWSAAQHASVDIPTTPTTPPQGYRIAPETGIMTPSATRSPGHRTQRTMRDIPPSPTSPTAPGHAAMPHTPPRTLRRLRGTLYAWHPSFPLDTAAQVPLARLPSLHVAPPIPIRSRYEAQPVPDAASAPSMSLLERIRAKEQANKSSRNTGPAGAGAATLHKRSMLSRLGEVADAIYFLYLTSDVPVRVRGSLQARVLPLQEVLAALEKSAKNVVSRAESDAAVSMLMDIVPGWLERSAVGRQEWLWLKTDTQRLALRHVRARIQAALDKERV